MIFKKLYTDKQRIYIQDENYNYKFIRDIKNNLKDTIIVDEYIDIDYTDRKICLFDRRLDISIYKLYNSIEDISTIKDIHFKCKYIKAKLIRMSIGGSFIYKRLKFEKKLNRYKVSSGDNMRISTIDNLAPILAITIQSLYDGVEVKYKG